MYESEIEEGYDMLLAPEKTSVEHVLRRLKKIGVPEDGRWQTLILYLRYISDYSYLTNNQKEKIQALLIGVIKKKKFDAQEYDRIIKELGNIFFEPYKEKINESLKETTELIKKFAEISILRRKHIESLEQHTISIIEKTDDIEVSIEKIKRAFKKVISLIDSDVKKLYEEVQLDGLTSLYNRKFLDIYLHKILKKCHKNRIPCCILMFDIDDFKNINDKYGHRIGDQALIMVAKIIKSKGEKYLTKATKGNFFAARYGGEEFCIVLEDFDQSKGYEFAELIRSGVEKYNFIIRDSEGNVVESGIKITISGGVSTTYDGLKSCDKMIEEADKALYIAKKKGKNRVEVFSADG